MPSAFVYTELHDATPFDTLSWRAESDAIQQVPGLLDKTWLSDIRTTSRGGFLTFGSLRSARTYVTETLPDKARSLGVTFGARIFDAAKVKDASRELNSPHFGATPPPPGAFVYTEMQIALPFSRAPWPARNPVLRQQPGLLAKTWLSGNRTNTLGGLYAFDSIENAWAYALNSVPKTAATLGVAPFARVFDAKITEAANRYLNSPYYQ